MENQTSSHPERPFRNQTFDLSKAYDRFYGREYLRDRSNFPEVSDTLQALLAGRTFTETEDALARSPRFIQRVKDMGNGSSEQAIGLIYTAVLEKPYNPRGQKMYVDQIRSGRSTEAVMNEILESGEYTEKLITKLYREIFERDPDESGKRHYLDQLRGHTAESRKRPLSEIIQEFKQSGEYQSMVGRNDRKVLFNNRRLEDALSMFQFSQKAKGRRLLLKTLGVSAGAIASGQFLRSFGQGGQKELPPTPFATASPTETQPKNPTLTIQKESPTPEKPVNLAEKFLEPLINEALERRKQRQRTDPEYTRRVDQELNTNRINFLLFGYGEEHGDTYADYGGSISVLSYDIKTGQIASFSLSRDIRTPELESLMPADKRKARQIRYVYKDGGFDLMRKITERATGLSVDFQIVLKDTAIRDFIEEISGPLAVKVDKSHGTSPYRLGGTEYPKDFIAAGEQELETKQAMRFILAEDQRPGGKEDERSYRKNILMRAIKKKVLDRVKSNPLEALQLALKINGFLESRVKTKDMELDFDLNLISRGLQGAGNALKEFTMSLGRAKLITPDDEISKEASIHDPYFGDGSVTRVHNLKNSPDDPNRHDSQTIREDVEKGYMPDWMLIPDGGDPLAEDLIEGYWKSIRKLVRSKLLS